MRPKKKGDKWEKKSNLNLGPIGSYELTYKFTYLEPDKEGDKKDFDKIGVETVINYTAPKEGTDGLLFRIKEGSKLTSDPAGSKGFVYYDPKNQRIPYAEINIKLKGDLTVVIGGTDTKVELTQEQKTTIKTGDTSFYTPPPKAAPAPGPTPPPPPDKKPRDFRLLAASHSPGPAPGDFVSEESHAYRRSRRGDPSNSAATCARGSPLTLRRSYCRWSRARHRTPLTH